MANRIVVAPAASERVRHAAADLQRYLREATGEYLPVDATANLTSDGVRFVVGHVGDGGPAASLLSGGAIEPPPGPEGYALRRLDDEHGPIVAVAGHDEAGAVYGTYALLETAYGCGFFLGSEVVPPGTMPLAPDALDLSRAPAFATRGLLPWYDFLSGPSAWNLPDYQLYFDRMVRMGLNFLGLHVYSKGAVTRSQGAEPFLSFTYHGTGHDAVIDTTQTSRWGYLPMRTSDFAYGTDRYVDREVFGADAAINATGPLDAVTRAKELLHDALTYAKARGLRVCAGFEPSAIPDEILRTLPANAKRLLQPILGLEASEYVLDTTSVAAQEILRLRLDDLLQTYPMVDAVWLWQNEDAAWTNRKGGDVLPFDAAYLNAAYDYLQERAPHVQLVVSGWGAVHQHFDQLHAELPGDVAFSALNHYLGSSQTDEVYGRLGERNRWPIPWLEDDATLWHPQYHVHRFHNDVARAHRFGCDGMIGIHWRTRVVDHVAAFFARALWQPDLAPADFYHDYASLLAGADAGPGLAQAFDQVDQTHRWPGWLDEALVSTPDWDHGHSNEAGEAFNPLPVPDEVMRDFSAFAAQLDAALEQADDPAARERIAYHRAQVAFVEHYVASQQTAREIDALVRAARDADRRLTPGESDTAASLLQSIDASVRAAIEGFAAVMTTTADLGVLASLNQKYVVRACWQRYDALREVAQDPDALPRPDLSPHEATPLRVFVPVPPEVIDGDGAELVAIVGAADVASVTLHMASLDGQARQTVPLMRRGRGVWTGTLRSDRAVRYWIEAVDGAGGRTASPPLVPDAAYSAQPSTRRLAT